MHTMTLDHPRHPNVPIIIDGETVPIDVELAPLIAALNGRGIRTSGCCQGDPGEHAYIAFDDVGAACVFLELVARDFSDDVDGLWNRVFYYEEPKGVGVAENLWAYWTRPIDRSVDRGTFTRQGGASVHFVITVTFPRDDIPVVARLVQ